MRSFILLVALICSFFASGQDFLRFGIKGGMNFPNLKLSSNSSISDVNTKGGYGYHVGAVMRLNLAFLYVQPEVLYTAAYSQYSFTSKQGLNYTDNYNIQRFDVPIPVGVKLGPVAIFAGPVVSFNISSPSEIFENTYKTGTWGFQAGAGVLIGKFLIEAKYEGPFTSQVDDAYLQGNEIEFDARTEMWILSLGFLFGD